MQIPSYIEVYNGGSCVAYLSPDADGLKDTTVDLRLNGESTLSFAMPMASDKWQYLTATANLRVNGREYVLLAPDNIEMERDEQNRLWGSVTAHESWYLLGKRYRTVSNDPQNPTPQTLQVSIIAGGPATGGYPQGSAGSALSYLLSSSGWTLASCDVTGTHDLEVEKESVLAMIEEVQKKWGGYLVWDSINRTVALRDEAAWQNYTGFQVRYAKNLKNMTKRVNNDIVTRLYVFGKDDLDIASVNSGLKYLDNTSYTTTIYEGVLHERDIDNPTELKAAGQKQLSKLCKPRVTYAITIADLRTLPEYSHEDFQIGDLADVIDTEMGVNIRTRVIRHKYNVFRPWECELEIGDFEERLSTSLAQALDASQYVNNLLKPTPGLQALMKGIINTFATKINSANGKLVWNDEVLDAIEIDTNGNPTGNRVRLSPGGIGVSKDGGQSYTTAMTGEGVLADKLIANALHILPIASGGIKIFNSNGDVVLYADANGNLIINDLTAARIIIKDGSGNVLIDGNTKTINFDHFTTKIGTLVAGENGIRVKGTMTWDATGAAGLTPPSASQVGALPNTTVIPNDAYITTITENTIKTTNVIAKNLTVKRISSDTNPDSTGNYAQMGSSDTGFQAFQGGTERFRVHYDSAGTWVTIVANGHNFLHVNTSGKVYANGTWDFQYAGSIINLTGLAFKQNATVDFAGANVSGLNLTAKFG